MPCVAYGLLSMVSIVPLSFPAVALPAVTVECHAGHSDLCAGRDLAADDGDVDNARLQGNLFRHIGVGVPHKVVALRCDNFVSLLVGDEVGPLHVVAAAGQHTGRDREHGVKDGLLPL